MERALRAVEIGLALLLLGFALAILALGQRKLERGEPLPADETLPRLGEAFLDGRPLAWAALGLLALLFLSGFVLALVRGLAALRRLRAALATPPEPVSLALFLLAFGAFQVAGMLVASVLGAARPWTGPVAGAVGLVVALALLRQTIGLAAVGLRRERLLGEVLRGFLTWLGTLPLFGLSLVITAVAAHLLGFRAGSHDLVRKVEQEHDLSLLFFAMLQAGLLAPLAEELLFRGLLLPGFQRALGAGLGLFLSALAFSCVHGALASLLPLLVLGLLFSGLRATAPGGSLVAPITAHALHNGTTLLLVGAALLLR